MSASTQRLLSVDDVLRLAGVALVCVLALASLHRPDLAPMRAVAAFLIAWLYGAGVIGRHLRR